MTTRRGTWTVIEDSRIKMTMMSMVIGDLDMQSMWRQDSVQVSEPWFWNAITLTLIDTHGQHDSFLSMR
jgi:hypothetical protein